jgi:hypothetical protein
MAHSCCKELQADSALAKGDDFIFDSELGPARPLNCSDTSRQV